MQTLRTALYSSVNLHFVCQFVNLAVIVGCSDTNAARDRWLLFLIVLLYVFLFLRLDRPCECLELLRQHEKEAALYARYNGITVVSLWHHIT